MKDLVKKLYSDEDMGEINFTDYLAIGNFDIATDDYSEENLRFWASYLSEVCEHISECERTSAECEYAVDDYYDAVFMQDKIGKTFEATIDGPMPTSFFVQTNDNTCG